MTQSIGNDAPPVGPYGELAPVKDASTGLELLSLPAGFHYSSFAWNRDAMTDGTPGPGNHDGMGVVSDRLLPDGHRVTMLIRNHESSVGRPMRNCPSYDDALIRTDSTEGYSAGGCTLLVLRDGKWSHFQPALGGTQRNCSGGVTPWGTWLTCEETMADYRPYGGKKHGYVFEVSPDPSQTSAAPILGMGRMSHEAVAVDPATNIVYLTEDKRNLSGLYRYLPSDPSGGPGALERGGRLQAARVRHRAAVDLNVVYSGQTVDIEWVDVADPDADPSTYSDETVTGTASGPFVQARTQGCLRMARGEGIWHHAGKMFIVDTAAGRDIFGRRGRGRGAVWALDLATMRMKVLYVPVDWSSPHHPDCITVSPRGGILLTEDGDGIKDALGHSERLLYLGRNGQPHVLCSNNADLSNGQVAAVSKQVKAGDYRGREFTGACFDASGRLLFLNLQNPGITFAIHGPWERGDL